MKEFYKLKMYREEDNSVNLWVHTFISFHETECYHYCLPEFQRDSLSSIFVNDGETMAQSLKRRGISFSRIHKTCSRKAFDTKEEAYDNFIYLKKKHLQHLSRDIETIEHILKFNEKRVFGDLKDNKYSFRVPSEEDFERQKLDEKLDFDVDLLF